MALKKKGTKRRRSITVDMEGVESGGKIVPDGTYNAKVEEIEEKESSNENDMLVVKWRILSGKGKGGLVWDNISLTPQALWRLKGLLEALEIEVPDGSMDLDIDELIGQEASIQITNEKYEGKDRPRVTGYGSAGEGEEEEEEEEEDERVGKKPKKPASKKPAKDEDEDEEEETEEEDEEGEDDKDDEDEEEEDEEEEKPKKPSKKPASKAPKFKDGQRVKFKDEDGKLVKGVVVSVDGDTVKVEDKGGDEWEIDASELEAL